jgi:hypothetical protein
MHPRYLSCLLVGICLSLVSATTIAQFSNSTTSCKSQRFDTSSLYDAPTKQNVFFVPSSGFIADRTFMAQSLMNGPSKLANELASWMTIAAECPLQLTVAGKNETKTLRVIKDAFDLVGNRDLRALDFTLVGSSNAAIRVEKWVRAVGGTFHSRPKLDE